MKKIVAIALCVIMAVFAMASCAPAPAESSAAPAESSAAPAESSAAPAESSEAPAESSAPAEGDKPLVGICVPDDPTGWVAAVKWSAKNKADELGLNYNLVAAGNVNDQANKLDELITLGCKYIVLLPCNDELAVAAKKVMDAGITLINFDRSLGDVQPDYYVAGDNPGMGKLGAEYIMQKLGDKGGKVAIMNIPGYGAIFTDRVNGFKEAVKDHKEIEVIGEWGVENGAPETVLPVMKDILTANPQIDAIYSTDDEMSIGILQAIKEANRTDIKVITGGGGTQSYFKAMDEYQDIWVSSQTYPPYMINDCLDILQKLINGETVEQTTIIPAQCVDRESYKQFMTDYGITADAPY